MPLSVYPYTGSTDPRLPTAQPAGSWWSLLGLIAGMFIAGLALQAVAGPPRLPPGLPSPDQLRALLAGSTLPTDGLVYGLVSLAWLLWLWIVGSLALELLVVGAEAVARGAAWASTLRRLSDRLTLPLVRRAVAAALAVQVLSRGVGVAAAQPLDTVELSFVVRVDQASALGAERTTRTANHHATDSAPAVYSVRAGDTLWSIAQSAYGSGTEYRRIVAANVGRRMPDGFIFSARGVIQPGWELLLPEPRWQVDQVDGERWYSVHAGDTLCGIAARLLHDETRWSDLFELNRGAVSPDGAHVLRNPSLIWPGLRLRLPADDASAAEAAPAAEPTPDSSAPAESSVETSPEPTSEPAELITAAVPAPPPAEPASLASAPTSMASAVVPPIEQHAPPQLRSAPPAEPVVLPLHSLFVH